MYRFQVTCQEEILERQPCSTVTHNTKCFKDVLWDLTKGTLGSFFTETPGGKVGLDGPMPGLGAQTQALNHRAKGKQDPLADRRRGAAGLMHIIASACVFHRIARNSSFVFPLHGAKSQLHRNQKQPSWSGLRADAPLGQRKEEVLWQTGQGEGTFSHHILSKDEEEKSQGGKKGEMGQSQKAAALA